MPLSYKLHADLATEYGGDERWGYRKMHCGQIDAKGRPFNKKSADKTGQVNGAVSNDGSVSLRKRDGATLDHLRSAGLPDDLDWVAPDSARSYSAMGDPTTTAQVHPYQFTTSMADLAREAGVEIKEHAQVRSIDRSSNAVNSVTWASPDYEETITTPASSVVLAAGAWTSRLLPSAPIGGLRAHSVTIRPSRPVSAYALFTEIALPPNFQGNGSFGRNKGGNVVTPEIYARPFNEVYACGEGDTIVPLPSTTAEVKTDDSRCQDIIDYVGSISDELRDGEVLIRQACYLPVARGGGSGGPWIGEVSECQGLVLAAGHSCWGIQNGPGTGKLVSEIVMDGVAKSAKLGMLDPKKSLQGFAGR